MKGFESAARVPVPPEQDTIDDFKDSPELFSRLSRLPLELRAHHIRAIEAQNDDDAIAYLDSILEKRESVQRESYISDETLRPYFEKNSPMVWNELETKVFTDTENNLGRGMTARVKRLDIHDDSGTIPESIAIKYLVTPTSKTLSVSGEHDLIREVEQMKRLEEVAEQSGTEFAFMKVPHPYFYYKKGKIQCYGMEQIDGINLLEGMENNYENPVMKEKLQDALRDIDREALMNEVERFFDVIHTICIHGDVKPANIMVSPKGKFYVIDFGQATLGINIDEKSNDAYENLKDEEKRNAKMAIQYFFTSLYGIA